MVLAILMIVGAGLFRFVAHNHQLWNVAPVGAMALLGGMYLGKRYALWVPVATLAVTDLVLNVMMGYPMIYTPRVIDYGTFVLIAGLGLWSRSQRPFAKIGCAAATPFLFYLISNFGVWLFGLNGVGQTYPKTLTGLTECYKAALPFLRGTMIGDWAFMALFAGIAILAQRAASPRWHQLVAEARA